MASICEIIKIEEKEKGKKKEGSTMDLDLTPKLAKKLYGENGGQYFVWSPSDLPMLREGNIGASKLALEKNGFALPRYSDSSKVAYVLQGLLLHPFSFSSY